MQSPPPCPQPGQLGSIGWLATAAFSHSMEGVELCLWTGSVIAPPVLGIAALFLCSRVLGLSMLKIKW